MIYPAIERRRNRLRSILLVCAMGVSYWPVFGWVALLMMELTRPCAHLPASSPP